MEIINKNIIQILETTEEKETNFEGILKVCKITRPTLNKTLQYLVSKKLINRCYKPGELSILTTYETTWKGERVLEHLKKINNLIED